MGDKKALDGLPVFSFEDGLKAAGLATVGMLKRDRRRPADGQQPAAKYWTAYEYAPLYAAADAVDLPPLSLGRQRRYDEARTCARCGAKRKTPFELGPDRKKRYCQPCQEPAAKELWDLEQAERHKASVEWAREVLADPTVILAAECGDWWSRSATAEDLDGIVVFDARFRRLHTGVDELTAEQLAQCEDPADVAARYAGLAGRRVISWFEQGMAYFRGELAYYEVDPGEALRPAAGDVFGRRYSNWKGERDPWRGPEYRHNREVRWQSPPDDLSEQIHQMRTALRVMAEVDGG